MGLLNNQYPKIMLGKEATINTGLVVGGIVGKGKEIKPGDFVLRTTTHKVYEACASGTSGKTAADVVGVCLDSLVNKPKQYPYNGVDVYQEGEVFDLFIGGEIAVTLKSGQSPKEGDPVWVYTEGENANKVATATDTGAVQLNAKFTGIYDGDLAVIRILA